ncbi:MAG: nickel-responsive transcriptional regulator NikR, partial [Bacteroidales bacterium]|nr:nickel-responsive transcriptional regulator NikR [Bacteroidales bacterium]
IVAGAIILLYNYEKKDVISSINDICYENREKVLSAQQFYLADESMISIIAVKGCSKELTLFSEQLIGIKGVKHGKLLMSRID